MCRIGRVVITIGRGLVSTGALFLLALVRGHVLAWRVFFGGFALPFSVLQLLATVQSCCSCRGGRRGRVGGRRRAGVAGLRNLSLPVMAEEKSVSN